MKLTLHARMLLIAALLLTVFAFGQSPLRVAAAPLNVVTNQKIAIPSYFYPGPIWTRLENSVPTLAIALINPNSGPGNRDATYAAEIARAHAKGIKILGYVHTSNGARPMAEITREVNLYYSWYAMDGIFFDEVNLETCAKQPYYLKLHDFVKSKGGVAKVIINPGTNIPECYITTADIIVNFESNYSDYVNWKPSGWEYKYSSIRFWHLIHSTPQANLANAITLSKSRNAGWVYVTPDVLENPWDTLPPSTYWTSELNLVKQ